MMFNGEYYQLPSDELKVTSAGHDFSQLKSPERAAVLEQFGWLLEYTVADFFDRKAFAERHDPVMDWLQTVMVTGSEVEKAANDSLRAALLESVINKLQEDEAFSKKLTATRKPNAEWWREQIPTLPDYLWNELRAVFESVQSA